jgi:GNAT superfamily N-acetyltransferase
MSLVIRQATDLDLSFAHTLTRDNMAAYYATFHRVWKESIFRGSWTETENLVLVADDLVVGILRISQKDDTLLIRDLQLLESARRKGHGTTAIGEAERIARSRGLVRLRLAVFQGNAAARLYQKAWISSDRRKWTVHPI